MYKVVWVYRKGSSTAPFFYEVPESAAFKAAIEAVSNQNPDLVMRETSAGEMVTLDKFIFHSSDDYKVWLSKFLEQLPNGLITRNKYIINNNQELFVRIEEPNNTSIVQLIPLPENT